MPSRNDRLPIWNVNLDVCVVQSSQVHRLMGHVGRVDGFTIGPGPAVFRTGYLLAPPFNWGQQQQVQQFIQNL
jgi:hypothetical protein